MIGRSFPEHRGEFIDTDAPPMPSTSTERDEDLERDWHWLCSELREFRNRHGLGRLMRCIADAVSEQGSLLK